MTPINLKIGLNEGIKKALLSESEKVNDVKVINTEQNEEGKLVTTTLIYEDGTKLEVSFFIYEDGTWFSPTDWQGWQPKHLNEIPDREWMLGVNGHKAIILAGVPRVLF